MPRKTKVIDRTDRGSSAHRAKLSKSMKAFHAKRRAAAAKPFDEMSDHTKTYLKDMGIVSLSAAAVSPATEISFVKSSVLARKETARQTIEDCDALLAAWERLGL